MKKISTLLFLFLFICLSSLWAGPVTVDKARRTAEEFFRTLSPSMTRGTAAMKLVYQPSLARATVAESEYYVFAPDTLGGFVIVSGDDTLTPVVGYSATEAFTGQHIPEALKAWLDEYVRYVGDVQAGKARPYLRDASRPRAGNVAVEPMVTTLWNQEQPYNDYCPDFGEKRAPSGCVATAMAQIMKFHNWPDVGEGSHTFYDGKDGKEVTIDFSKSVYDWKNMRDEYSFRMGDGSQVPDYTEQEGNAVAKLMYECGRAVDMEYLSNGSGAYSVVSCAALVDYFKYSPQLKYYYREAMTTDEWIQLIRENLKLRQPLLYSGKGDGGHAFVCDGINENDYVHINWGWSGYWNGYFDMAYLAPSGTGIGGGGGYYFRNQAVAAGIRPRIAGETAPENLNLIGQNITLAGETSFPIEENVGSYSFRLTLDKVLNGIGRPINADVGFCIQRDGVWQLAGNYHNLTMEVSTYYDKQGYSVLAVLDPGSPEYMKPGSYEAVLCYKLRTEEEWHPMNCGPGPDGVIVEVSESDVKIRLNKEIEPGHISFVGITTPLGTLYNETNYTMTLTFKNVGESLFNRYISVAFFPESVDENTTNPDDIIRYSQVITPYVYGKTEMEASLNWRSSTVGKHRVRLFMQEDNGTFTPIPEKSPVYVTFVAKPESPVPMLQSQLWVTDESEQSAVSWVNYAADMNCVALYASQYIGKMALYASKKGDLSGKEYKLLETDVVVPEGGDYIQGDGNVDMGFMEPGDYVSYLKYDAGDGNMVKVTPDEYNSASFVLKPSSVPAIYVSAPIVVNEGRPIARGSSGVVEVTVSSFTDYTGEFRVNAGAYNAAGDYLSWVLTPSGMPSTVTLKAGVPMTLKLSYFCNEEAVLGDHQVEFVYSVGENIYRLSLGEYKSTCGFTVVETQVSEKLRLNSPLIINEGHDVVRGSRGQIRFSLISGEDFTAEFYPNSMSDAGYVMIGTSKRVTLQANIPQEVTLEYECPADAELGQQKLTIYYLLDGVTDSNGLDYGGYESSSYFNVAISTGIEDTPLSGCVLITRPDAFLLKGMVPGSSVHLTAVDGRVLFEGTAADAEMSIPMSGVAAGLYIVTVKTPDGEMKALKGRRW